MRRTPVIYKIKMLCRLCTNTLIFEKNIMFDQEFELVRASSEHCHEFEAEERKEKFIRFRYNYRQNYVQERYSFKGCNDSEEGIIKAIKSLPPNVGHRDVQQIISSFFGIDQMRYELIQTKIRQQT